MNFLILCLSITTLAQAKEQPVWDYWYTVTANKTNHQSYYNDRVEKLGKDKVIFKNHVWKKEEGYINEEQLGASALADEDLTPAFYNFHSTFGTTEKSVDGTVTPTRIMTVKAEQGTQKFPVVTRSLPKGTIFSVMLELWLGARFQALKSGKELSFSTVIEDNVTDSFPTVPGRVKPLKADEFATKTKTLKLQISYSGHLSTWYVEPTGAVVRIEMPDQQIIVDQVSEATAKKFLSP